LGRVLGWFHRQGVDLLLYFTQFSANTYSARNSIKPQSNRYDMDIDRVSGVQRAQGEAIYFQVTKSTFFRRTTGVSLSLNLFHQKPNQVSTEAEVTDFAC